MQSTAIPTVNPLRAARMAETFIRANRPCMIEGRPGAGKSQLAAQLAARMGLRLIDFRALLRDPVDLRGLPMPDMVTRSTTWLRPDDLPFMPYDGAPCLILMDEINTAPMSMQNACLGLVLDRKAGSHVLHPETRILAAGNRQKDRAGVTRMSSALESRFARLEMVADVPSWSAWYLTTGLPAFILAFIRFRPELLDMDIPSDGGKWADPRAWESVARMFDDCDPDIRQDCVAAIVGQGPAAELEGFHRIWRNLPRIADILANPDGAPLPRGEDMGTLYALSGALARAVDGRTFGAALRYMGRLPQPAFQTVTVLDATARDPGLKSTRAFADWAIANQDVAA